MSRSRFEKLMGPGRVYRPYEVWGAILDDMPADGDALQTSTDPRVEAQWEQIYTTPCHDHHIPRFP